MEERSAGVVFFRSLELERLQRAERTHIHCLSLDPQELHVILAILSFVQDLKLELG